MAAALGAAAFDSAYARTRDKNSALRELDRLQQQAVARDAAKVWGEDYPISAVRMTS